MTPRNNDEARRPAATRLLSVQSVASTKRSFRSHSSSFQADDEHSSTTDSGIMSPLSIDPGSPSPRFHGEDTRPTSNKELRGWYMYAFAAETYPICAISAFIPIFLESLARENGVSLSDPTQPCGSDGACVVSVLGIEINTASFAMYTFSISVLLQALLVVSISCAADHGNYRKSLLFITGWVGGACVMLYIFIFKEIYIMGAVLAIISNMSFGTSFVLLNSFLPLLVRNHPQIRESAAALAVSAGLRHTADASNLEYGPMDASQDPMSNSTTTLLSRNGGAGAESSAHEQLTSQELNLSTEISAKGVGIGYGAALGVQIASILILVAMGSTTWAQRVVLLFIGSWWVVFSIPAAMWLRPRPGPPLPASRKPGRHAWVASVIYSWQNLFRTVKLAGRLVDIVLFLGGWFLLSDAVATTSSTAILFAKTHLGMKPWALGMINTITTVTGIAGAFSWSWISRHFQLKPHQTILSIIFVFELIPIYGLMGYLPFVQEWQVLGLQQPWEMFPLAAVYGFVLGGLGSYCRSLFGELIPPGSEAAFYALYAITDKGSSVFGPSIVGAIIDRTGEIRPAFWFLAAVVGLPATLIYFVDVERGRTEGEKLAKVIEGHKNVEDLDNEGDAHEEAQGLLGSSAQRGFHGDSTDLEREDSF